MKKETLNLHGLSLEEALAKIKHSLDWGVDNDLKLLIIIHGKGHHSSRNFSVLKQEIRKYLKNEPLLKENGYILVLGESNQPIALTFDDGISLVVKKGFETSFLGDTSQQQRHQAIFSEEGKLNRKIKKRYRR